MGAQVVAWATFTMDLSPGDSRCSQRRDSQRRRYARFLFQEESVTLLERSSLELEALSCAACSTESDLPPLTVHPRVTAFTSTVLTQAEPNEWQFMVAQVGESLRLVPVHPLISKESRHGLDPGDYHPRHLHESLNTESTFLAIGTAVVASVFALLALRAAWQVVRRQSSDVDVHGSMIAQVQERPELFAVFEQLPPLQPFSGVGRQLGDETKSSSSHTGSGAAQAGPSDLHSTRLDET